MKKLIQKEKRVNMFKQVPIIFILVSFLLVNILSRVFNAHFDYDEGYNLQIALNLNKNGQYATFDTILDPQITTGPTVIFPAMFFIVDSFPVLPRLVVVSYFGIFLFICFKYILGRSSERVFFLLLLCLTPLLYFFSSHALGELPGFVLLVLSLISLKYKKYLISGVVFFLSILTKNVYILGAIPFLYLFVTTISLHDQKKKSTLKKFGTITVGFLTPAAIWEFYKLYSLNLDLSSYIQLLNTTKTISSSLSTPHITLLGSRLDMLGYVFDVDPIIFTILSLFMASAVFYFFRKTRIVLASLSLFYLVYFFYFMLLGSTNWYRHLFPGILAFSIIVPVFLLSLMETKRKNFLYFSLSLLFLFLVSLYTNHSSIKNSEAIIRKQIEQNLIFFDEGYLPLTTEDPLFISQQQTANYINQHIKLRDHISGIAWWSAPEVAYLAQRRIYRNPFIENGGYIISHFYGQILSPQENKLLLTRGEGNPIFQTDGYTLYKMTEMHKK